ncbi:MAG: hypothetical protein QM658_02565 [Gordonia sp. (in: high G+C Gram-positive bacteria)]
MAGEQWVGVVAEHDLGDRALVELIRGLGFPSVLVDLDRDVQKDQLSLGAVVVRQRHRVEQVTSDPRFDGAACAMIATRISWSPVPDGVTLIPAVDCADQRLEAFLEDAVGRPSRRQTVPVSPREREVLTTYVLGSNVVETAARHYVATSTVRTHYRRVTDRYAAAGRPVANKTQLLLQLIADGWIRLDEPDGEAGAGAA